MAVVVALILLLWGIKYAGKGNYFVDNFPVSQTRALKGIFAIYVIFRLQMHWIFNGRWFLSGFRLWPYVRTKIQAGIPQKFFQKTLTCDFGTVLHNRYLLFDHTEILRCPYLKIYHTFYCWF